MYSQVFNAGSQYSIHGEAAFCSMSPIDFKQHFQPSIRVQLDWNKFAASCRAIDVVYFSMPGSKSLIFTPWYASQDGGPCRFSDAGAVPQSLAMVAQNKRLLSHYKIKGTPPKETALVIPAYRLPGDAILLLDGNHRCVSYVLAESNVGLFVAAINGPIDRRILPDLVHWE
ncbi:MAG: hypothetical protein R3352_04630 [Salinisphaeraceae bacterium]|nr:hypothetical protein [Salinisphaeraceae bacterium]